MSKVDVYDLLAAIGAVLVSVGAGMIYVPAGFIVAGVVLMVFAVLGASAGAARGGGAR